MAANPLLPEPTPPIPFGAPAHEQTPPADQQSLIPPPDPLFLGALGAIAAHEQRVQKNLPYLVPFELKNSTTPNDQFKIVKTTVPTYFQPPEMAAGVALAQLLGFSDVGTMHAKVLGDETPEEAADRAQKSYMDGAELALMKTTEGLTMRLPRLIPGWREREASILGPKASDPVLQKMLLYHEIAASFSPMSLGSRLGSFVGGLASGPIMSRVLGPSGVNLAAGASHGLPGVTPQAIPEGLGFLGKWGVMSGYFGARAATAPAMIPKALDFSVRLAQAPAIIAGGATGGAAIGTGYGLEAKLEGAPWSEVGKSVAQGTALGTAFGAFGAAARSTPVARGAWSNFMAGVEGAPPGVHGSDLPVPFRDTGGPGASWYGLSLPKPPGLGPQGSSAIDTIVNYSKVTGDIKVAQAAVVALSQGGPQLETTLAQLAAPIPNNLPTMPTTDEILKLPAPTDEEFKTDPMLAGARQILQADVSTLGESKSVGILTVLDPRAKPETQTAFPVVQIDGRVFALPVGAPPKDITYSLSDLKIPDNVELDFTPDPSAGIRYKLSSMGSLRIDEGATAKAQSYGPGPMARGIMRPEAYTAAESPEAIWDGALSIEQPTAMEIEANTTRMAHSLETLRSQLPDKAPEDLLMTTGMSAELDRIRGTFEDFLQEKGAPNAQPETAIQEAPPSAMPEVPNEDLVKMGQPPEGMIQQVLQQPGAVALARAPKPGQQPRGRQPLTIAQARKKIGHRQIGKAFDMLSGAEKVRHINARRQAYWKEGRWELVARLDPRKIQPGTPKYNTSWTPTPSELDTMERHYLAIRQAEAPFGAKELPREAVAKRPDRVKDEVFVGKLQQWLQDPELFDKLTPDQALAEFASLTGMEIREMTKSGLSGIGQAVDKAIEAALRGQAPPGITVEKVALFNRELQKTFNRICGVNNAEIEAEYNEEANLPGWAGVPYRLLLHTFDTLHSTGLISGQFARKFYARPMSSIGPYNQFPNTPSLAENWSKAKQNPFVDIHENYQNTEEELRKFLNNYAPYHKMFIKSPELRRAVSVAMAYGLSGPKLTDLRIHDQYFPVKLAGKKTKMVSLYETVREMDKFRRWLVNGDGTGLAERGAISTLGFEGATVRRSLAAHTDVFIDAIMEALPLEAFYEDAADIPEFNLINELRKGRGQTKPTQAVLAKYKTEIEDLITVTKGPVKKSLKAVYRLLPMLLDNLQATENKIQSIRDGSLYREDWLAALHFMTNDDFRRQVDYVFSPVSMEVLSPEMRVDFLNERKGATKLPYTDINTALLMAVPQVLKMVHLEPTFHKYLTEVPLADGTKLREGWLTTGDIPREQANIIVGMWKELKGFMSVPDRQMDATIKNVAMTLGRETLPSQVEGLIRGETTAQRWQRKPLAGIPNSPSDQLFRNLTNWAYSTLLSWPTLTLLNALDMVWYLENASKRPPLLQPWNVVGLPIGVGRSIGTGLKTLVQTGKRAAGRTAKWEDIPPVYRVGALQMTVDIDEAYTKGERSLRKTDTDLISGSLSSATKVGLSGGRAADTGVRGGTFEEEYSLLQTLGFDKRTSAEVSRLHSIWRHGSGGIIADAYGLKEGWTKFFRTLTGYTRAMTTRMTSDLYTAPTLTRRELRLKREALWRAGRFTSNPQMFEWPMYENPPEAGVMAGSGAPFAPEGAPSYFPPDEQTPENLFRTKPLLGGFGVQPSDEAIWAARRGILGWGSSLFVLFGVLGPYLKSIGLTSWRAFFMGGRFGAAGLANIGTIYELANYKLKENLNGLTDWEKHDRNLKEKMLFQKMFLPVIGPILAEREKQKKTELQDTLKTLGLLNSNPTKDYMDDVDKKLQNSGASR